MVNEYNDLTPKSTSTISAKSLETLEALLRPFV